MAYPKSSGLFIKRCGAEPPDRRLSTRCAFAHKRIKLARSGSGKKSWWQKGFLKRNGLGNKFMLSTGRRIPEIRDGCGEKCQGIPRDLGLKTWDKSNSRELHSTGGQNFLPSDKLFLQGVAGRVCRVQGRETNSIMRTRREKNPTTESLGKHCHNSWKVTELQVKERLPELQAKEHLRQVIPVWHRAHLQHCLVGPQQPVGSEQVHVVSTLFPTKS